MNTLTVDRLPNGLYRVYDYRCQWAACYAVTNGNIQHVHGAVDADDYRNAVKQAIGQ